MKDVDALLELLRAIVDDDDELAMATSALLGIGYEELEALRADVARAPITEDELDEVLEKVAAAIRKELRA